MEKQEVTYLIFFITIIFLMLFIFILSIILNYYRRNKKYNRHILEIQYKKEQEILKSQLEIQEQTLKTISQEIHDNIGQVLSLAKLNINTMSDVTPQVLQEKINDSKHLISKAIQDLRDISRSLNTDYVNELGLLRSIEYELELIKKTGSFEAQLNIEGKPFRLEQQQELIIFRIVQEALHNIIKHAQASVINVQLRFNSNTFTLTIEDNGVGFDASQLEQNNYNALGLGIRNIYNRAKLINSTFNLSSVLNKGTTLTLSLPLITNKS